MQDLSQVMVELFRFTDSACGSVHNTLQSVSDRLHGSSKYSIALVNAVGHECMNKCSSCLRVKLSSDTSELTQPVERCCGHVGHVMLQTQVTTVQEYL